MTRRERIIEILDNELKHLSIQNRTKMLIANEILAIPLDVPTDKEIEKWTVLKYSNVKFFPELTVFFSAKWAIEQVIERNKK